MGSDLTYLVPKRMCDSARSCVHKFSGVLGKLIGIRHVTPTLCLWCQRVVWDITFRCQMGLQRDISCVLFVSYFTPASLTKTQATHLCGKLWKRFLYCHMGSQISKKVFPSTVISWPITSMSRLLLPTVRSSIDFRRWAVSPWPSNKQRDACQLFSTIQHVNACWMSRKRNVLMLRNLRRNESDSKKSVTPRRVWNSSSQMLRTGADRLSLNGPSFVKQPPYVKKHNPSMLMLIRFVRKLRPLKWSWKGRIWRVCKLTLIWLFLFSIYICHDNNFGVISLC